MSSAISAGESGLPLPPPPLARNGDSPSGDRRTTYTAAARGGHYDGPYGDRDAYRRGVPIDDDRDREWQRRRVDTRGRSRSPGYSDDGRRKRRTSFSPGDRDRYEPRPRYEEERARGHSPSYPRPSRFQDPYESETPVPLRQFIEWFAHTSPEEFASDEKAAAEAAKGEGASNVGIKARYEKYRKTMIAKQMQLMFQYHVKFPWFNEKYNPASPYTNLRLRVRREGWDGRIDKFIDHLVEGKYDHVVALDESTNGAAGPNANGAHDGDKNHQGSEQSLEVPDSATINGDAEKETITEERSPDDDEDTMMKGKPDDAEGDTGKDKEDRSELRDRILSGNGQDVDAKLREEEVTVEPEGNQVLIRTIPPDIGRVKLEKACRSIQGFIHLGLGDTMQKRNFYRAGWIQFKDDADMTSVIERLGEEKIEGFKLHVSHSTRPFSARARYTPDAALRPERISKDLAAVKKLAAVLEDEAVELLRLPDKLPEPCNLPKSKGGELPDEENGVEPGDGNSMEEQKMAVDDQYLPMKDRGSVAVEERLEKLVAELEIKHHDGGADNDVHDVFENKKNLIALDLYLSYLRAAFNCCYYCSAVTDHVEELQRKCIKHNRRPPQGKEPIRDERWEEQLDQKTALLVDRNNVDPRELGGKHYDEELSRAVADHIKQEDEGKFRCKKCAKLFKAIAFVEKHISTRHPELVSELAEIPFYNNWALDPHKIQPFTHIPPPNANGQSAPPEAFGLRHARRDDRGGPRNNYGAAPAPYYGSDRGVMGPGPGYPPYTSYAQPMSGGPYYGAYPPPGPPPPIYDYYRGGDPYFYPPNHTSYPPHPPPRGGYGDRDRRSPPPRGGRLSDRLGGFAPDFDGGRPGGDGNWNGRGGGGRGRRGSMASEANGRAGAPGAPTAGGPPPPGAKEDPRAGGPRRSYHDIDQTAEGDVELSY